MNDGDKSHLRYASACDDDVIVMPTFPYVTAASVAVVLAVFCTAATATDDCPCNSTSTWRALSALYASTNGSGWRRRDNWLKPNSTVCRWEGFTCFKLSLVLNNLNGTLPVALSELAPFLNQLNLSNNAMLSGTLPREFSALDRLNVFDMSHCNLSGTLPREYSALESLNTFGVSNCNLSGTLPPEYASWVRLLNFNLQNNSITGALPHQYSAWVDLHLLDVSRNRIIGSLPPEYKAWIWASDLSFHINNIRGTLPSEYAALRKLVYFRSASNNVEGSLPEAYSAWTAIRVFTADANYLSGTLPAVFASWGATIVSFSIAFNQLTSTIPDEYSNWTNLVTLALSNNLLMGTLPASLGRLPRLTVLMLNDNSFVGVVPSRWSSLPSMGVLALHNNKELNGTIPAAMPFAVFVSLCNTSLCGALPLFWRLPPPFATAMFCAELPRDTTDASDVMSFLSTNTAAAAQHLRSCSAANTSDATETSPQSPLSTRPSGGLAAVSGSALVATVASIFAASTLQAASSLQVSLSAASMQRKRRLCSGTSMSGLDVTSAETAGIGAAIIDNPTRIAFQDPLPHAQGASVGNLVLLVAVPVAVGAAHAAVAHGIGALTRQSAPALATLLTSSIEAFLVVFGTLCVPTAAAATSLMSLVAASTSAYAVSVAFVVCICCGILYIAVPTAAVLVACACANRHARSRIVSKRQRQAVQLMPARRATCSSRLRAVVLLLTQPVCTWDVRRVQQRWVRAVAVPLLAGVRFQWVVAIDCLSMTLQGVLVGVATSSRVSCGSSTAASWALLAVCSALLVIAVVVRPRQTIAATCLDILMTLWTTAAVLVACLIDSSDDDRLDALSTAQAVVQLCCSLPLASRRVYTLVVGSDDAHRLVSTARRSRRTEGLSTLPRRGGIARHAPQRTLPPPSGVLHETPEAIRLSSLVALICDGRRHEQLSSVVAEQRSNEAATRGL